MLSRRGLAGYVVLAVFLLLTAGRLAGFPLVLLLASGHSMEPTINRFDLLVCISTRVLSPSTGDIVVWYLKPLVGTVHRVVSISDGLVTTKGDANPRPDPPVPRDLVKYKVALVIPREAWAPLALLALAYYARRSGVWRSLVEPPEELSAASLILASFLIVSISAELLVEVPILPGPPEIPEPRVDLHRVSHDPVQGRVSLIYQTSHVSLSNVSACTIRVAQEVFPCRAWVIGVSEVRVEVPRSVYTAMYRLSDSQTSWFTLQLNVTLDKGSLQGVYAIHYTWRPLDVNVTLSGVRLRNPNPIPFNVSVHASAYNIRIGKGVETVWTADYNVSVDPGKTVELPLESPPADEVRVVVSYTYRFAAGGEIVEAYTVRGAGG